MEDYKDKVFKLEERLAQLQKIIEVEKENQIRKLVEEKRRLENELNNIKNENIKLKNQLETISGGKIEVKTIKLIALILLLIPNDIIIVIKKFMSKTYFCIQINVG